MSQVDWGSFSPEGIRRHAAQFSVASFRRRFADEIARVTGDSAYAGVAEGRHAVAI